MSWKRMIFGEKTPDKNDPQYKERYQKEVDAGRKTARFLKIDKLSAQLQTFASNRPKTFLAIVISVMVMCLCYNIYCVVKVFSRDDSILTATEIQRQRIEKRKAKDAQLIQSIKSKAAEKDYQEDASFRDAEGTDVEIIDFSQSETKSSGLSINEQKEVTKDAIRTSETDALNSLEQSGEMDEEDWR